MLGVGHVVAGSSNFRCRRSEQRHGVVDSVTGDNNTVNGSYNQLTGNFSSVTGSRNFGGGNGIIISGGTRNVAIGENANIGTNADDAISLGSNSQATQDFTTAMGSHAVALRRTRDGDRQPGEGDFCRSDISRQ